jgi:hypothetical protein
MWLKAAASAARSAKCALSRRVFRFPPAIDSGRPAAQDGARNGCYQGRDRERGEKGVQRLGEIRQAEDLEVGGGAVAVAVLGGDLHTDDKLGAALELDDLL